MSKQVITIGVFLTIGVTAGLYWQTPRVNPEESYRIGLRAFERNDLVGAERSLGESYSHLSKDTEEYALANRCLGYIKREHHLDAKAAKSYYDEAYSHLRVVKSVATRVNICEERAQVLSLLHMPGALPLCAARKRSKKPPAIDPTSPVPN